ncbi:MAG: NucA/NucB deoxyribonuclease domain-containing protein [Thiohalocapsa sp.]
MSQDRDQGRLPVLEFDGNKERTIAENIYHAQQAGWPKILTYDHEKDHNIRKQQAAWKRNEAMNTPGEEVPAISSQKLHRDEYPFACTKEHNGSAWIGHAVAAENRSQGGQLRNFLEKHGAIQGATNSLEVSKDGRSEKVFKFIVEVKNWPPKP